MPGPLRLNVNSRPGSAALTMGVLNHAGPRLPLFLALKRAPTMGPVAPLVHVQRLHSGLHSPMRVMSETSWYTRSGDAAISTETESCGFRCFMAVLPLCDPRSSGLTALICH